MDIQIKLNEAKIQYDREKYNRTIKILKDVIEELECEMEPIWIWENKYTKEIVKADISFATISYDEHNDETMVFIGETNVVAATISGEIDENTADEILKENGWVVKKG